MILTKTKLARIFIPVAIVVAIPMVAMLFTDEVNWSATDFLLMGTMVLIVTLVIEYILLKQLSSRMKWGLIGIIVFFFLLLWAEMAVGIFNSPIAGT